MVNTSVNNDYWSDFQAGRNDALFTEYVTILERCSYSHYEKTGLWACRGCDKYIDCVKILSAISEKCCDTFLTLPDFQHYLVAFNKMRSNGHHVNKPKVKQSTFNYGGPYPKTDRNNQLYQLRDNGMSIPQLASTFSISHARVSQLLKNRS